MKPETRAGELKEPTVMKKLAATAGGGPQPSPEALDGSSQEGARLGFSLNSGWVNPSSQEGAPLRFTRARTRVEAEPEFTLNPTRLLRLNPSARRGSMRRAGGFGAVARGGEGALRLEAMRR